MKENLIQQNLNYALDCFKKAVERDDRADIREARDFYKKAATAFSGLSEQLRLLVEQIDKDIDDLKQHCYDLV